MKLLLQGTPNPKQAAFFLSSARHTAYGGARGGGKSWAMRRKFVLLAFRYEGLQLLLLRRTLPELTENHVRPLLQELNGVARYNQSQRCFLFPNGSRIKLGYCDLEKDVYQYQGQEYDVIGLEEATHFTESQMQFLTTCNRSVRRDFSPRMYYTCNPGGVGHGWVKRLFLDRQYREGETPAEKLRWVQDRARAGESRAIAAFSELGRLLGLTLPWYQRLTGCESVLLLGRVVDGVGGECLVDSCRAALESTGAALEILLPEASQRRVGQAAAAAFLNSTL